MVLINLDRLYDETLYDFCGCFKQYALNRYLRQSFKDLKEYWGPIPSDEDKQVFNNHRHEFPNDTSILGQVELYKRFCLELLFTPEDHSQFYETLIMIGRNIERNTKTQVVLFNGGNPRNCREPTQDNWQQIPGAVESTPRSLQTDRFNVEPCTLSRSRG